MTGIVLLLKFLRKILCWKAGLHAKFIWSFIFSYYLLTVSDNTSGRIWRRIGRGRRGLIRRRGKNVGPIWNIGLPKAARDRPAATAARGCTILPGSVVSGADVGVDVIFWVWEWFASRTWCCFVRQKILLWWITLWESHKCVAILLVGTNKRKVLSCGNWK